MRTGENKRMSAKTDNDITGQYLVQAHNFVSWHVNRVRSRLGDDRGAVMAEYGLLIALIALLVVTMLLALNGTLTRAFTEPTDTLNTAVTP